MVSIAVISYFLAFMVGIQLLSLEWISIIGRKLTDDFPGYSPSLSLCISFMKPFQHGWRLPLVFQVQLFYPNDQIEVLNGSYIIGLLF